MKYCKYDGCINKIDKGVYCPDHRATRRKKKVKAEVYHHENKPFYRTDEWKRVRQFVYEREHGNCQRCGKFVYGRNAHVHHIVTVKDNELLKLEPNNLMLLCAKCHPIVENEDNDKKVFPSYF